MINEGKCSFGEIKILRDKFAKCDLSKVYEEWNAEKLNLILNDGYLCRKVEAGLPEYPKCNTYVGDCRCGNFHDINSWPDYYKMEVLTKSVFARSFDD
jgi:hypothetical protein